MEDDWKVIMEMPGIEPGAFHMQSERSTTELHPPVPIMVKNTFNVWGVYELSDKKKEA